MTDLLRAVFDTNVFVSAFLSRNPSSPTKELLRRWENGEFRLIVCAALINEVTEKLLERHIEQERVNGLATLMVGLGDTVHLSSDISRLIPADPDDDAIIACALEAKADFLVTYDPHFDVLGGECQGVKIVKALPFLWAVRCDQPPGE